MKDRIIRNPVEENRIGRFRIATEIIQYDPQKAMYVLKDVIVVKSEALFYNRVVEYFGYSNYFESVPFQEDTPYYHVVVRYGKNGKIRKRWVMDA